MDEDIFRAIDDEAERSNALLAVMAPHLIGLMGADEDNYKLSFGPSTIEQDVRSNAPGWHEYRVKFKITHAKKEEI